MLRSFSLRIFNRFEEVDEAEDIVQHHNLIGRRQMAAFFPDAEIEFETVLGLTKSIIAIREAALARRRADRSCSILIALRHLTVTRLPVAAVRAASHLRKLGPRA